MVDRNSRLQSKRDTLTFHLGYQYLLSFHDQGVTKEILENYIYPGDCDPGDKGLPEIYQQILESAQNAGMKRKVIGDAVGGVKNLGQVLFNFDHHKVLEQFESRDELLASIRETLKPIGKNRDGDSCLWPKYCETILSGAEFLMRFSSKEDFHSWVKSFDSDIRSRSALPFLIQSEVDGLGFALACDFLKDLGYHNFGKPDVHLKNLLTQLNLVHARRNKEPHDLHVLYAIDRIAKANNMPAYSVDKLFWLIGSGKFYDHKKEIGQKGMISSNVNKFVKLVEQDSRWQDLL